MTREQAEKVAELFVDAIRGSGNADLMWENDEGRQKDLDSAVADLILRVQRKTREEATARIEAPDRFAVRLYQSEGFVDLDDAVDAVAARDAAIRRETREECAKVCDFREADGRDAEESAKKAGCPSAAFSYGTRGVEARRCAAAIRAMEDKS